MTSVAQTTILSDSRLSITLDGDDLRENFQVDSASTASHSDNWVPVVRSKSSYPDAYNERTIHLSETMGDKRQLDLTLRAYNEGVAFRYTLPEQPELTDFTIESDNSEFQFYDAGWYGPERDASSNPVTYIDAIDIMEVIRYADARGIGLICYINKIAMSKYDLDKTFRTYEEWGIRGVKFGFVDWEDQSDMEFLFKAIRKAAQYHLIVDIHDNFRLTGIERTYLHVLTVEGILGNEERADRGNPPKNVLTTSFARMIAGAGDFTPCFLNGRVVSRSFQLALGVVFYSPLQYLHWYDQMDQYEGRSFPELEFWKEMPTVWDDSRVIHGSIGNYMTVARRKGKDWFVGTITNDGRKLDIPLAFLGPGKHTAKVYREDLANKKYVTIETVDVTSGSTITASMSSGSGHAIWIHPSGE